MDESTLENKYFSKAKHKASEIFRNREKLNHLLEFSKDKLSNVGNSKLVENIKVFVRMIKSYKNGSYREIPLKGILAILAAIIYFAMPIDLIPDFIPVSGFIDDFAVVMWVSKSLLHEIETYKQWENSMNHPDE